MVEIFPVKVKVRSFLPQLVAILNCLRMVLLTVTRGGGGGWGAWSCHSQCLRPLSLHCQALEGCRGYPKSVCHPP